jgi:acyl-CoA synthetase (AMP-forming)/AMP-acid ligase II
VTATTDDRPVLAFGERRYSVAQLEGLADGMASTLAKRGVRSGQRVALMSSNRVEFVVAVRAIWRLGAAVVLLSPAWKRAEVDHALALTDPAHGVGDHPVLAEAMPMLHLDESLAPGRATVAPLDPRADALLVFSSGTTGMPKAVRHTHASFTAAIRHWQAALQMTSADRMQIVTPASHILGLLNIMTALRSGAWLRLHQRFDVDAMLHHVEADRVTIEMTVAPIAFALASHPKLESFDLSSLRYIMWCATPVAPGVAETITRRTGVNWLTAYGTSELPVIACSPLDNSRLDTVGRPVPGVRVRIGEQDEIQARADSLMAGYVPACANTDAFCDGWFRTGDVGSIDNGWLRITDRSKEMIKVRGFQVAPAEIEAVLHGHPAVDDCAVFGAADPIDGERIVAAVATRESVTAEQVTGWVSDRLASYKRLADVVFVSEIPRLPSGKVLRRVLKERYGCPSDH